MIQHYKDPEGETVFEKTAPQNSSSTINHQTDQSKNASHTVPDNDSLRKRVKELEDIVSKLKVQTFASICWCIIRYRMAKSKKGLCCLSNNYSILASE